MRTENWYKLQLPQKSKAHILTWSWTLKRQVLPVLEDFYSRYFSVSSKSYISVDLVQADTILSSRLKFRNCTNSEYWWEREWRAPNTHYLFCVPREQRWKVRRDVQRHANLKTTKASVVKNSWHKQSLAGCGFGQFAEQKRVRRSVTSSLPFASFWNQFMFKICAVETNGFASAQQMNSREGGRRTS